MNKQLLKLDKTKLYSLGLVLLMLVSNLKLNAETIFRSNQDDSKITLKMELSTIKEVLNTLQDKTSYDLFFSDNLEGMDKIVSVDYTDKGIEYILTDLLSNTKLEYSIEGKDIVIKFNQDKKQPQQSKYTLIKGRVLDEKGEALPGVNIVSYEDKRGAISAFDGSYQIEIINTDGVLTFSFMGMETVEEPINGREFIDIQMEQSSNSLDDVVLTGYMPIQKKTFTGSAVKISAEEIAQVSNTNVLSAISVFEPSFKLDDNILQGSDPNRLPDYTVRGKGSLDVDDYRGNPNLPIFILDGFEVPQEKVYDLDITRIESVTILKDASATAIYGSRAANGIVVLETKKPKAGALTVNFTSNTTVNVPDLSSYDLLNAQEKLDLEYKAGYFEHNSYDMQGNYTLDSRYNRLSNDIKRGVDTYWLSEPVQTTVDQQISLYVEGGDQYVRYGLDANYKTTNGVMKGSGRDVLSLGFNLSYNYKNVIFRNYLSVDFGNQKESRYGNYSQYGYANPYYSSKDENGDEKRWLEQKSNFIEDGATRNVSNPLYNASLNSSNGRSYSNVMDQFSIDWKFNDFLRWKTDASFWIKKTESFDFVSPYNTSFDHLDLEKRGTYSTNYNNSYNWNFKSTLMFNKNVGVNYFSANVGFEALEDNVSIKGYLAQGFPNDYLDELAFALQYAEDSTPYGQDFKTRSIGVFSYFNYTYDDRYFVNASYRTDGSSAFGADKRFAPFWSAGIGWNIHNEGFFKNSETINNLRIRTSIGETGTTQFNPTQSLRMYQYDLNRRYRGQLGSTLISPGNDDLEWQSRFKRNIGLDLSMFKSRLNITVDVYNDLTKNLLTDVALAPSTGFDTYKENLGEVSNKGYELKISGIIYRSENANINLFVNTASNTSEITKISDALRTYNEAQNEANETGTNKPLTRFAEGQSYTAIWGVKSLGIDPADGQEIFVTKNGEKTKTWSSDDITIIGDTEADIYGFFGTNARYKGFELQASFRFSIGGERFNQTLLDKIENADLTKNTDRRVLTSRWQKPGDVTEFKDLKDRSITKVSSRFVQDDNYLQFANLSLGYNFSGEWMKKIGLSQLKTSVLAYDIFHISSIEVERGIEYPFARSISLSVRANF